MLGVCILRQWRKIQDMSKADEDRAREKFADKMREKAVRVRAEAAASEARKKAPKKQTPAAD
jgi:hypothetical protein